VSNPVDFAALPAVRELEGVSRDELATHPLLSGDEPVVLRGLVSDWPLAQADYPALLDRLEAYATSQPIPVYAAPPEAGGRVFYDESLTGFNFERRSARLGDCCQWLKANAEREDAGLLYVGSTAVQGWLPGFAADHPLDLGSREHICSLWLGNRSRIAAHFDFPRNLACVVSGRRRFTIFPPEQFANLYPGPLELTPSGQPISLVDFYDVDSDRFPRFADALAASQVADLGPGDALYLPGMWWHHVESLEAVNLLINYWWRDSELYLGSPYAALLHAALAIGQLGEAERGPWRALFEHYALRPDSSNAEHIPAGARGVLGAMDEESAYALRRQLARFLNN
jgi:hypothetical protein